jgi:hypothetical protein
MNAFAPASATVRLPMSSSCDMDSVLRTGQTSRRTGTRRALGKCLQGADWPNPLKTGQL